MLTEGILELLVISFFKGLFYCNLLIVMRLIARVTFIQAVLVAVNDVLSNVCDVDILIPVALSSVESPLIFRLLPEHLERALLLHALHQVELDAWLRHFCGIRQ